MTDDTWSYKRNCPCPLCEHERLSNLNQSGSAANDTEEEPLTEDKKPMNQASKIVTVVIALVTLAVSLQGWLYHERVSHAQNVRRVQYQLDDEGRLARVSYAGGDCDCTTNDVWQRLVADIERTGDLQPLRTLLTARSPLNED